MSHPVARKPTHENKDDGYVWHVYLGECRITPETQELQSLNPDPSSFFVEFEGEIREVTKSLLSKSHEDWAEIDK